MSASKRGEDIPLYRSHRQGGRRYGRVLSTEGAPKLNLAFEDGLFIAHDALRRQVESSPVFQPIGSLDIFGVLAPINVEIGSGNGEFISHKAKEGGFWIGFEPDAPIFKKAVKRLEKAGLTNARIVQFDAEFFVELLPPESVSSFYINFPDPWPKKRHNKRRLLKSWFIALMAEKLGSGGLLTIVTDHEDYAKEICLNLEEAKGLLTDSGRDLISTTGEVFLRDIGGYYRTKYYRKFAEKGKTHFFEYTLKTLKE